MKEFIRSDLFRYYGNTRFLTFILAFIKNSGFRYMVIWRICKTRNSPGTLKKVLFSLFTTRSISIDLDATIGYGLYIAHNGSVVINGTAIIGNNCNLSQFTTIGSNEGHAAKIGDNVYIGPGVSIVEDVQIGSNVTIGAGSVVTKDIPDGATAAGNYARVLNYRNPGRYVTNRWHKQ